MSENLTFRYATGAGVDRATIEREFRNAAHPVAVGETAELGYFRCDSGTLPSSLGAHVERLPDGVEVFAFDAHSMADAQTLVEALAGRGGLGGIHSIMRNDANVVIEYIGDLFLLFDCIDALRIDVVRRALVPLDDASLIAVANVVWRDGEIRSTRILERAALDT